MTALALYRTHLLIEAAVVSGAFARRLPIDPTAETAATVRVPPDIERELEHMRRAQHLAKERERGRGLEVTAPGTPLYTSPEQLHLALPFIFPERYSREQQLAALELGHATERPLSHVKGPFLTGLGRPGSREAAHRGAQHLSKAFAGERQVNICKDKQGRHQVTTVDCEKHGWEPVGYERERAKPVTSAPKKTGIVSRAYQSLQRVLGRR